MYLFFFSSNLILGVPMRKCCTQHFCISFTFPMAIGNGACRFTWLCNTYSNKSCAVVLKSIIIHNKFTVLPVIDGGLDFRHVIIRVVQPSGRVDDFSFFDCLSTFCFLLIEFVIFFPFPIKYHIMFIFIVFWLGCDGPSGLLFFVPALTLFHTHASLLTFFVCFFILFHSCAIRECLGKHSCMSSPFPTAILNGTYFFSEAK